MTGRSGTLRVQARELCLLRACHSLLPKAFEIRRASRPVQAIMVHLTSIKLLQQYCIVNRYDLAGCRD